MGTLDDGRRGWRRKDEQVNRMANVTTHGAMSFGLADRVGSFLRNLQDARRRYKVYRQTLAELSSLSERDLSDLGINRSMISSIALEAAYMK